MNTIKVPFELFRQASINKDLSVKSFDNFIFNDFVIQVEGMGMDIQNLKYTIHFVPEDKILTVQVSEKTKNGITTYKCQWIYQDNITVGVGVMCPEGVFKDNNEYKTELASRIAKDQCHLVLWYMGYIMNYPRDRKQTRVSSHKYSREYRLSTRQNRIYLFSDILKYVSDTYVPEGQHHNIQCPCWEVRGHYRHYKSGKVVFIKSFKKGKKRNEEEPKPKIYYM